MTMSFADAGAERPDRTRIPFLAYPAPLRDRSGALTGAVNAFLDIVECKRTQLFAHRLASIAEPFDDATLSADLYGIIRTWNPGAERLFGYMPEEVIGKPITFHIPMERHDEESGIFSRIRRGGCIGPYETVRQRKDGYLVEISLTASTIKNAEGGITGVSLVARDITERRRAQEQQNLLLKELSRRVKNLFAVAPLSARSARTPAELAEAVEEWLGALGSTRELTQPGLMNWGEKPCQDKTLQADVQTIFASYVDPESFKDYGFLIIAGPCLPVGGNAITNIALVMHELATNAAKYWNLSSPGGYIHVDWSVKKDELLLTWKEFGGPSLDGPAEGFENSVVRPIVTGRFGGQLSSCGCKPEGLIRLSVPVESRDVK